MIVIPAKAGIVGDRSPTPPAFASSRSGRAVAYPCSIAVASAGPNSSRSTQEIVLNDGTDTGTQTSVDFSGGVSIPISIVTLSFTPTVSHGSSQDVSHGSEIHFTNCIECASQIWRQQVETLRTGDVYRVRVDG